MKKVYKITLLSSLCILIFLCQSCIIDEGIPDEDRPIYYLTGTTKNYVVFKTGSRWIYKQEGENTIDTNTVTKDKMSIVSGGRAQYDKSEVHQRQVYSSFHKDTYTATASNTIATFSVYSEVYVSNYFGNRELFYNGQVNGQNVGIGYVYAPNGIQNIRYTDYYPIYEISGKQYAEVMLFECTKALENQNYIDVRVPYKAYFAKNVGIIRKEMKNGEIWNLVSYEVKQ